jgi:hypothetical protein
MSISAIRRLSKAEAFDQFRKSPALVSTVSAAARLWGTSRSTARMWLAEFAASPSGDPAPATTATMAAPALPPPRFDATATATLASALALPTVSAGFSLSPA